jgi:hypothetical protein
METVKIDAQKLQLLNDRISQTIDALNQVRLSTHGLQHSGPQIGASQWIPQAYLGVPQAQVGVAGFYGQAAPRQGAALQTFATGIDHSNPGLGAPMRQMSINPGVGQIGYGPQVSPVGFGQAMVQGQVPFGTPGVGISHTSPATDPYWQLRNQRQAAIPQYVAPPLFSY